MDALSGPILATVSKAVAAKVGGQLVVAAAQGAKKRVLGDPAEKALKRALQRAYDRMLAGHGGALADYDVNPGFLQFEAASELAKTLLPGAQPSANRMAELCVDSLGPQADEDVRWDRMVVLRPAFKTLLEALHEEIGRERALDKIIGRADEARATDSAERIVQHFGAARATDDDEGEYLRWLIDNHKYLRTAGMVRNTIVQMPLQDVFVKLAAAREDRPGDRADARFRTEQKELHLLRDSGKLDQRSFDEAIDRLRVQLGSAAAWRGDRPDARPVALLDAVRNSCQLLVLGEPGSGKTTLLRYLALCHANALITGSEPTDAELGRPRFPVYIRIGDYARSARRADGISAFLLGYFKGQECPTRALADLLDRKLASGDCLVLLDGLDEVTTADDRREVVEAVTRLVTAVSRQGNRFVATSRIAGYVAAPLPASSDTIRVLDMDDPTIERFLGVYCSAVERIEAPKRSDAAVDRAARIAATDLIEALGRNVGVRRLAANPLLLTTMLLVHRARGRLPHRRIDAYVEVTEALGRTWRSVQGVPEAELPDDRLLTAWLTRLGSWLHEHRPGGSATKREILEVLGPPWSKLNGTEWDSNILQLANPLE